MYYYNIIARLTKHGIKSTHIFSPVFPKHLMSLSANMALVTKDKYTHQRIAIRDFQFTVPAVLIIKEFTHAHTWKSKLVDIHEHAKISLFS